MDYLVFATSLHLSAQTLAESNFFWVISGWVNAALYLKHYRPSVAIEPHRHDLLVLMLVVFPLIELNRWLGAETMGRANLVVDVLCLVGFTFYIGRFSIHELRRLEDRLNTPGMCADSLMISTALLACVFPVLLGPAHGATLMHSPSLLITVGYLTPGVFMMIGTGLMVSKARMKLEPTEMILMVGSVLLFSHFALCLLAGYATPDSVLSLSQWSNIAISAAGAIVMLYTRMPAPPSKPRQALNHLGASSLVGATLLVLALPATWLALGEQAERTPLVVWVFCGAACTAVLSMRLIPLLKEALRWKLEYQRLALQDSLTGLDNRHAIDTPSPASAEEPASDVMVFCIDLDDFKSVNDLYGHPTGDRLLRAVADSLRRQVEEWQTQHQAAHYRLARLGGDEFLILITSHAGPWSRVQMLQMAEELYHRLARWWDLGLGNPVFCKASVGCETKPASEWQAALHSADLALYASKRNHTGPVASQPPTSAPPENRPPHRQQIRQWTHQALDGMPLPLDLQAIVCAETHEIKSYEVLARLPHPEAPGQRLMPGTFLGVVDSDGLHRLLCRRILETLATHHEALKGLHLSINIDPAMLTSVEAAQWLHTQVLANRLEAKRITLEVLEKQVTYDASLGAAMSWLAQQGYRLAMDDFGSGYSNLQRLSELPFSVLKIDAAVIQAAAQGDDAPLQSIHRMAVQRNMSLVAEGVATVRQLAAVQRAGIKLVQGFLHARPHPIGLIAAHEVEMAQADLAWAR
ncbi:EAL domain-containing protein [Ideonella paludis]|uniref:EAL domain-containing protein n=1 Tax=Ideonella paludis TaxID=1233411 RepID=UPI00362816E1